MTTRHPFAPAAPFAMRRPAASLGPLVLAALALIATAAPAQGPVAAPGVSRTLANGLEVRVLEDHDLPLVHFRLLVPAGSRHEAPEQAGLARLTAELIQYAAEGAAEEKAPAVPVPISLRAERDFTLAAGTALARNWQDALPIFARRLLEPEISEVRFDRVRRQALSALAQSRRDPAAVAGEHLTALVQGGHPYARPTNGSETTLLALAPADVSAFHATWWKPGGATLAIAGDVDAETAFAAAERAFGGWPAGETPSVPTVGAPDLERTRIRHLDRPGAPSTELRIGWPGVSRDHPEFLALDVLLHVLGAPGLESRLARALRETVGEEGSIAADASYGTDSGTILIAASVPHAYVRSTVEAIRSEIEKLAGEGIESRELEAARRHFLGSYRFGFQTRAAEVEQALLADRYGLPPGTLAAFPDSLAALDVERVSDAARRWLTVDPMVLVAVGPAEEIGFQLQAIADVETLPMGAPTGAIPEIALPEPTPTAPATEESRARAIELVDAALEAHGGHAALAALQGWKASGSVEMSFTNPPAAGRYAEVFQSPDRRRVEMSLLGQSAVQVVDGERGWGMSGGQVFELPEDQVEALQVSGLSNPLRLLQALAERGLDFRYAGDEMVAGRPVEVVEWVRGENDFARIYFDRETGLLAQLEQREVAPVGTGYVVFQREYRDYRTVAGLEVPHQIVVFANGNKAMVQSFSEVLVNEGYSEETFRRPIQ